MTHTDALGLLRKLREIRKSLLREQELHRETEPRYYSRLSNLFNEDMNFQELLESLQQYDKHEWSPLEINSLYGRMISEDFSVTRPDLLVFGNPNLDQNYEITTYAKKGESKAKLKGKAPEIIIGQVSEYSLENAVYIFNNRLYGYIRGSVTEANHRLNMQIPTISVNFNFDESVKRI